MKIVAILIGVCFYLGMSTSIDSQVTSTSEEAIARIIDSGLLEGHDQKVIGGIGDAAAVIVTKVVRGRELQSSQVLNVLIVLNMAFGDAVNGPDCEPKTTLFVLHELDLSTSDSQLKTKIAQTKQFIDHEYAKSKQATAQH